MEREVRYCTSADGTRIAYSVEGMGPPIVSVPFFIESLFVGSLLPQYVGMMLGFGVRAAHGLLRLYTIATILLMVVFGILMGTESADVSGNEPTPWLGIWERLAVEGPMVWISVFAASLLRRTGITPTEEAPSPRPALSA